MNLKLIAEIAYQYYVEDLNQSEISDMYSIGRTTVSRMLKKAKKEGIVEFKIDSIDPEVIDTQNYLKEKYDIQHVIINTTDKNDDNAIKNDKLYQSAGKYLNRVLDDNQNIGISWGGSIAKTVQYLPSKKISDSNLIPLVGGPNNTDFNNHVNTIIYELSLKTEGKPYFINAAVIQEEKSTKTAIVNSKYFKETSLYWDQIDLAVAGIGGILSSDVSKWRRETLTEEDYELLRLDGAVGDICSRFINKDGHLIRGDLNDRTVGIELDTFKKIPKSIGIARGKSKVSAIKGVLKNNLITDLVTDLETAKRL